VPASPANPPHLLTCGDTNRYTPTPPQSLSSPSRSTPTNRTFVVLDGPTPTSASTRNRGAMAPAARSAPRHRRLPAAPRHLPLQPPRLPYLCSQVRCTAPPLSPSPAGCAAPPLPPSTGEVRRPSSASLTASPGGMCRPPGLPYLLCSSVRCAAPPIWVCPWVWCARG
jgi:hypothetical protein